MDDQIPEESANREYYAKTQGKWKKRQISTINRHNKNS